ncbi:hypothetical protein NEIRO03_1795 [Nematocida sp. AWRm78]|nr:hypothetical protein NEIRO02_1514 [Nematocida sp. AWRm79]KAI5184667.1 hypothetical protein NEIRO03_1795 [Nematocida sp. AWRm78]
MRNFKNKASEINIQKERMLTEKIKHPKEESYKENFPTTSKQDAEESTEPDFSGRLEYYTMYLDVIGPEIGKMHKTSKMRKTGKMLLLKCKTIEELHLLEKKYYFGLLTYDEICEKVAKLETLLCKTEYNLYKDDIDLYKIMKVINSLKDSANNLLNTEKNDLEDILKRLNDIESVALDYINEKCKTYNFPPNIALILNFLEKLHKSKSNQNNSEKKDKVNTQLNEDSLISTSNERQNHIILPEEILNADLPKEAAEEGLANICVLARILPRNIVEMFLVPFNALWDEHVGRGSIINILFWTIAAIIVAYQFLKLFPYISGLFPADILQ